MKFFFFLGSESDTESGDSDRMEEGSQADCEHTSGAEGEINDNNDPVVDRPSEVGDSKPASELEVLNLPQEPTRAFLPQSATLNVKKFIEIPKVEMATDIDATAGLETVMDSQEEPTLMHGHRDGEFQSV